MTKAKQESRDWLTLGLVAVNVLLMSVAAMACCFGSDKAAIKAVRIEAAQAHAGEFYVCRETGEVKWEWHGREHWSGVLEAEGQQKFEAVTKQILQQRVQFLEGEVRVLQDLQRCKGT